MKNRILVFEYLHADADLFQQVDPKMRGEGRGMLEGVLSDLSAIQNVAASVVCSKDAATVFENFGAEHCLIRAEGPEETGQAIARAAAEFDAVIPIAPTGRIGVGGMAVVYRAVHSRLQREVAVKCITASRAASGEWQERFRREVLAGGRLDHPSIVQTLDARLTDDYWLLVMELVDGHNLSWSTV